MKKLYIEKMSNDLDEFIRSEICRQIPGRLLIVLWAGEAGDKGIYLTKIHGGEKKVAERLVSGLKKALQ